MGIPYSKEEQLRNNRQKKTAKQRGKFSDQTKQSIFERDNGQCVRCGTSFNLEHTPHHIIYKSQLGKGTEDNGVTICRSCHGWAHACREGREWFEQYRNKYLLLEEAK